MGRSLCFRNDGFALFFNSLELTERNVLWQMIKVSNQAYSGDRLSNFVLRFKLEPVDQRKGAFILNFVYCTL